LDTIDYLHFETRFTDYRDSQASFLPSLVNTLTLGFANTASIALSGYDLFGSPVMGRERLASQVDFGIGLAAMAPWGRIGGAASGLANRLGSGFGSLFDSGFAVQGISRQAGMLRRNVGFNISPESWFSTYSTLGRQGTSLTDYRAIGQILGPVRANQQFSTGWFSGEGQVSYFSAGRLEFALGLERGSLMDGFRFTRVSGIADRSPRSPLVGNQYFLGPGRGLPGGGPELVVDPVGTLDWP
jgi:hypothetical protein